MKQLSFHFRYVINMDAPITGHRFTLRCIPQTDARQRITELRYGVLPNDFIESAEDQWGNAMLYGVCREKHSRFEIDVSGTAQTGISGCIPETHTERCLSFLYPTQLTKPNEEILQFARENRRSDVMEQAANVSHAMYERMIYSPGVTTTTTTAAEAFSSGRGVCQDYAHIMLAVLRAQGIPARYVVGMMIGEGQSHAWVEALINGAWYAFDPTNDQPVADTYISFAHGRDYADCVIDRGIFRGSCRQNMEITSTVKEI